MNSAKLLNKFTGKGLFGNVSDVEKDYRLAKSFGYSKKDYYNDTLSGADPTPKDIKLLKTWLRRK